MLGWPLMGSLGGSRGDTVTGKIGARYTRLALNAKSDVREAVHEIDYCSSGRRSRVVSECNRPNTGPCSERPGVCREVQS
jgi:hypothetical protein